jgi:hypothetical protein
MEQEAIELCGALSSISKIFEEACAQICPIYFSRQPLLEIEERVFEMTGLEQEHDEYREMLQATHEKLEIKEKHISEKQKILELLAELNMKTKKRTNFKAL